MLIDIYHVGTKFMNTIYDVIVVGSGNAGMSAALAALEITERVLVIEKASFEDASGNTAYSAGSMRCTIDNTASINQLIDGYADPRLSVTRFPIYTRDDFLADLTQYNNGSPPTSNQLKLVDASYEALLWLRSKGVLFEPNYDAQATKTEGGYSFWGGSILRCVGEGLGLAESQRLAFLEKGGAVRYSCSAQHLVIVDGRITGIQVKNSDESESVLKAHSIILASGGFGSNKEMLSQFIGADVSNALVRGTRHNTGDGLKIAFKAGANPFGIYEGCHIVPTGITAENGSFEGLSKKQRLRARKVCYHLGVMLNKEGRRFVNEGADFRNNTYAQYGRDIMLQSDSVAYQFFDAKSIPHLYDEYNLSKMDYFESESLDDLISQINNIDAEIALKTISEFNASVDDTVVFDPSVKDGKGAHGLTPPRTNWAQCLDTPPFRAYPVTGGITFTYGGIEINADGAVVNRDGAIIQRLFACGEIVGGVFFNGYPSGAGLTSGTVFGRIAGYSAANSSRQAHEMMSFSPNYLVN